jgi:hypothetical protein
VVRLWLGVFWKLVWKLWKLVIRDPLRLREKKQKLGYELEIGASTVMCAGVAVDLPSG